MGEIGFDMFKELKGAILLLWLTGLVSTMIYGVTKINIGSLEIFLFGIAGISTILLLIFIRKFYHASQNEKRRWGYLSDYPKLFCKKHFFKPALVRKAFFYYDVCCRSTGCSPDEFTIGINEVIGMIGAHLRISGRREVIYISLWSEKSKTARNADIDILEIRNAKGINYDYAINAVLMALKNDTFRPMEYIKQIPVVIHGNPPISEGAMRILKHEFKEVKINS
ncbi:MAG: hypothetical protein GY795_07520 [Desulfobacterales bacterium]|nr:hypothetical protein [Desulfobacterales bacterium]